MQVSIETHNRIVKANLNVILVVSVELEGPYSIKRINNIFTNLKSTFEKVNASLSPYQDENNIVEEHKTSMVLHLNVHYSRFNRISYV